MIATGVPEAHLYDVWPDVWPLLEPAWKASDDKSNILAQVRSLESQLWGVYDSSRLIAGIVTRLLRVGTSGDLNCHLWLVGGSRLSDWAGDFIPKLKDWSRSEGCVAITGNGRPGWARIVARFGGERIEDRAGLACWRLKL